MSEIDLTTDERKKMLHEEWFENNKEYEELLTEEESAYSGNLRSAHLPEKARNIEPLLNLEWNRVTAIDPAALDNGALINLKRYKIPDINIHEIQENHYRDFMENHKQVDEYVIDLPERRMKETRVIKKKRKVVKKNEFPLKSEPDLGCFPQLPLIDLAKIKSIQFLLRKIDALGQDNKD